MTAQLAAADHSVSMIRNDDTPESRFQVVAYGSNETAPQLVKSFATQGEVVSWLLCNGYKWVPASTNPQQWVKN